MQIAFAWNPESEKELLELGFKKERFFLKFENVSPTEKHISSYEHHLFKTRPYQFKVCGFFEWDQHGKTKASIVQIIINWRKGIEHEIKNLGLVRSDVYVRDRDRGPTVESNRKGNAQFSAMKNPPRQFITTSYWGLSCECDSY